MSLVKRSVSIGGHRTSISLEAPFHAELEDIAAERKLSLAALIADIDAARSPETNLSSAIRLFILANLKSQLAQASTAETAAPDAGRGRRFSHGRQLSDEPGL